MKKMTALLLAITLAVTLCACGTVKGSDTSTTGTDSAGGDPVLMAGYGAVNITPETSVPIYGDADSSERMSTGFISYIYSIAVAVTDAQGNTAVFVSVDNCSLNTSVCDPIREWVRQEYGIPTANILISANHQRSCPDYANSKVPSSGEYKRFLIEGIEASIAMAMEDRAPTELYVNTVQTEALTFVRNYWTLDGTMVTPNYGTVGSGIDRAESEPDEEMRLVKFVREAAKDIVLVNFQAHAHWGSSGNGTNIHSDWVGVLRDKVAQELGCEVIYLSGASGNLNATSRIAAETVSADYVDHGNRAAAYVVGAEDSYTRMEAGSVEAVEITCTYNTDHSSDYLLEQAKEVNNALKQGSSAAETVLEKHPELHSVYHATAIVSKAAQAETRDVSISAIAIGEVVFTVHPYEMFDTNGLELRSGTVGNEKYAEEDQLENPYSFTVIATIANGAFSYIPSLLGYTNGGYSTDISKFAAGTGEELVTDYLRLLNELHN